MPEVPQEAVTAAVDEIMRRRGLTADHSRAWAEPIAIAALEGAAPLMAEAVAQRILAHMEAHGPHDTTTSLGGTLRRARRRHFRIAAQVASLAFSTEEDIKREAAEAINRGDFAACWLDAAGRSVARTREEGNRDH